MIATLNKEIGVSTNHGPFRGAGSIRHLKRPISAEVCYSPGARFLSWKETLIQAPGSCLLLQADATPPGTVRRRLTRRANVAGRTQRLQIPGTE
jgi:hypothetical protein